nr:hypothetical protein Iba_chr01cCG4430 [Ipomoea batatas]
MLSEEVKPEDEIEEAGGREKKAHVAKIEREAGRIVKPRMKLGCWSQRKPKTGKRCKNIRQPRREQLTPSLGLTKFHALADIKPIPRTGWHVRSTVSLTLRTPSLRPRDGYQPAAHWLHSFPITSLLEAVGGRSRVTGVKEEAVGRGDRSDQGQATGVPPTSGGMVQAGSH